MYIVSYTVGSVCIIEQQGCQKYVSFKFFKNMILKNPDQFSFENVTVLENQKCPYFLIRVARNGTFACCSNRLSRKCENGTFGEKYVGIDTNIVRFRSLQAVRDK